MNEEIFRELCEAAEAERESERKALQDKVDALREEIRAKGFILFVGLGDEYGGMQGGDLILGDVLMVKK